MRERTSSGQRGTAGEHRTGRPGPVTRKPSADILWLQRQVGNRATSRLLTAGKAAAGNAAAGPLVVQRLMDPARFTELSGLATDTNLLSRGRNKVKGVDNALTAYVAADLTNPAAKLQMLDDLIQSCSTYLARPADSAKRQVGVNLLKNQAIAERPFVARAAYAGPGLTGITELTAVQDEVVVEARKGRPLAALNNQLAEVIANRVNQLSPPDKKAFMAQDVHTLTNMANDASLPAVTRRMLQEIVANVGKVDLTTGPAGAGFVPPGHPSGKTYFAMNNAKRTQGTPERLAALTHELTHISVSESYKNSKMMWSFMLGRPDTSVKRLSDRRVDQLDRLLGLVPAIPNLLDPQRNLLTSQLTYAKRPNLQADQNALTDDEKAAYTHLEQSGVNWSALVEFDTNVNQCLLLVGQWGVPPAEPFYALLQQVAQEAYLQRQAARKRSGN
jgi:hypothetical protein